MLDRILNAALVAALAFGFGAILAACTLAAWAPAPDSVGPFIILGPAAALAALAGAIAYREGRQR